MYDTIHIISLWKHDETASGMYNATLVVNNQVRSRTFRLFYCTLLDKGKRKCVWIYWLTAFYYFTQQVIFKKYTSCLCVKCKVEWGSFEILVEVRERFAVLWCLHVNRLPILMQDLIVLIGIWGKMLMHSDLFQNGELWNQRWKHLLDYGMPLIFHCWLYQIYVLHHSLVYYVDLQCRLSAYTVLLSSRATCWVQSCLKRWWLD